jgi:hypothetical protein
VASCCLPGSRFLTGEGERRDAPASARRIHRWAQVAVRAQPNRSARRG